jgi:RNA polymerase sigma-70 factor (ECF subfamily)
LASAERHDGVTIIGAEAQAVQDGVRDDAWDAIVTLDREHGQRLYGYALRLGVDSGRAGDLVQEALLRLWRELSRGAPVASREAWTYRTVARLAMDEHRLDRRIARLVARLGDGPAPRPMEVASTERVAIWAQVDRLPDRQRQVIYLRYQADLSFEDIGQVMGIEPGAARSYATTAHRTLRSALVDGADR